MYYTYKKVDSNCLQLVQDLEDNQHKKIFWLDSALPIEVDNCDDLKYIKEKSRYSYIGVNPIKEFVQYEGESEQECLKRLDSFISTKLTYYSIDENDSNVKGIKPQYYIYISYDFGERLLGIHNDNPNNIDLHSIYSMFCHDNWIYDHMRNQMYYIHVSEEKVSSSDLQKRLKSLISSNLIVVKKNSFEKLDSVVPNSNFTYDEYIDSVKKVKNYILEGDVYQMNLSQLFSFKLSIDPFELYRKVRLSNPTAFSAYIKLNDKSIISSSPERFLYKNDGKIYSEPIKGTKPRGKNKKEDNANICELLSSEKELSENIMIVDLMRNDLGRISKYGTVEVEDKYYVEKYNSVLQLVSRVKGELKSNIKFSDIINETFPGGSITGCPKIRAMEIISELENSKRGLYTGTIGRIDYDCESFDLSIVIRTILKSGNDSTISLGGGIVFDSKPESEFQETIDKGSAIIKRLREENE